MKSALFIAAIVFICGIFAGVSAGDVLYLKNGGKVEGKIVKETDAQITIEIVGGEIGINKSTIKKIERKEFVVEKTSIPTPSGKKAPKGYTGNFMKVINSVDARRKDFSSAKRESWDKRLENLAAIRNPRAVPALIDLVVSTDHYYVRINGLMALSEATDTAALTAGLPHLLMLLNPSIHWSSGEDKAILYKVLGKCLTEDGVPYFVEFLQAKDKGFTEESFGKVIHIKLSEVEDFTMRRRLFDALTEIEGQDQGLIELYRLVLKHEDPEMRHRAVDKLHDRILTAHRRKGKGEPLPDGVSSDSDPVIAAVMPDLSARLADEDIDTRRYTATVLLAIQEDYKIAPKEAVLKECLYSRDKEIRRYTVRALTRTQSKEAITILVNFLEEADSGVVRDSLEHMRFVKDVDNIMIAFNCRNAKIVNYGAGSLVYALKNPSEKEKALPIVKDVLNGKDRNRIIYVLKALKEAEIKDKGVLRELAPALNKFRSGKDTQLAVLSYEATSSRIEDMLAGTKLEVSPEAEVKKRGFLANLIQRWRTAGITREMAEQKSELVKEEVRERVARSRMEAAKVVKSSSDQKYESDEREYKWLWEEKKGELEALAELKWRQREITGMRRYRYLKGKIEFSDREERYVKIGTPKDKLVRLMGKYRQVDCKKQGNEEWLTFWNYRTKMRRGDTVVFHIVDDMVKGWITLPAPRDVDDARQECLKFLEQAKYQGLH